MVARSAEMPDRVPFGEVSLPASPPFEPEAVRAVDADLVERVRQGERRAEALLYERHAPIVHGVVTRLLRSRDEAQDVLQDTFLSALGELEDLRDPSAFRGWLLQIAVRHVHRRFRRRRFLHVLGLDRERDASLERLAVAGAPLEVRAELALLDRVLEGLPAAERIAWVLRRVEGFALEEVADACACSLATVKRRIAAADARVAEHLEVEEVENG